MLFAACDGANAFTGTGGGFGFTGGSGAASTGRITGNVSADGTGLGGVSVIVVGRDSTTTDGTGAFAFDSVPAGTYTVSVQVPIGYSLAAGQTTTQNANVTSGGTTGLTFLLTRTTTVP